MMHAGIVCIDQNRGQVVVQTRIQDDVCSLFSHVLLRLGNDIPSL